MNIIKHTAPHIDDLIKSAQGDPVVKDKACARALNRIINDIQAIKIEWLRSKITNILSRLKTDQSGYNKYLDKNLPYKRRKGRILRQKLWEIFPVEEEIFKKEFSKESLDDLEIIVNRSKNRKLVPPIKELSSGDFFKFCEMAMMPKTILKAGKRN